MRTLGAVLISENAQLSDPGVKDLAKRIIDAQRAEIAEMKQCLQGRALSGRAG